MFTIKMNRCLNTLHRLFNQIKRKRINLADELDKYPETKLAEFWCQLNRFEFPDELKHLKPSSWKDSFTPEEYLKRHKIVRPIMNYISRKISYKSCYWEWNKSRMSASEFEDFWATSLFRQLFE